MSVAQTARFACGLYARRLALAYYGYLRRDPMCRLHLRGGRDDPYAIYDEIRRAGTLVPTRMGTELPRRLRRTARQMVYVTASHAVSTAVLRDRRFGVRSRALSGLTFDMSFLDRDPPDHTRLRRLAQPAFGPRRIAAYRPRVEARVDELLDAAAAGGEFDLVSAFAAPLPIAVITDLLGVPDADTARFAEHGAVIGGALGGVRSLTHAAQLKAASHELRALFERLFALRRAEPADDVVSRIVAAEGDQITPDEMLPLCILLLVAGFETTVNLIGNAVHALLRHPGQWAELCADPAGLAPAAIEETLRWDPPVQRTARYAREDLTLAGRTVVRDQFVVTLLAAANRDPAVYPDPDVFDLHRTPAVDHLAFSAGVHYCVGAPLARMEATIALQRLAERMPGLTRAGALRRRPSGIVRGPLHFPVRCGTRVLNSVGPSA